MSTSTRPRAATRPGDRIFRGISLGAAITIVATLAGVAVFLTAEGVPGILASPDQVKSGQNFVAYVAPLAFGTLWAALLALLMAVPVAVGIALFISHFAPRRLATGLGYVIDLLAAVPSVVYGLWGIYVLAPAVQPVYTWLTENLGFIPLFRDEGFSAKSTLAFAGVILAIMILPIITALSREVFAQTPQAHKDAATALGATKWEVIRTAVLPFGKPGIISASMLGLGRALGETVAVMMIVSALAPGAPWNWSLFNGGETFASKIANNAGEFDNPTKTGAYIAAGLVLFILTFVVNSLARIVIERRKAFSE